MSIRVLHINRNYIFNRLHQTLIDELDRHPEVQNKVFVPNSLEQNISYNVGENVIVSKCFRIRDKYLYHYKQNKIFKALKRHYRIDEFDVIHAYTLFTDGGCAYKIHKKYGRPYVVAIRNTDINDFFKKLPFLRNYGIRILKDAEAIFFLSRTYKDILIDNYIPEKDKKLLISKMQIIPNGVDPFWLLNIPDTDKELSHKQIKIIYAGRIDQNKNIETTAKAIELLIQDGISISFTVIGKIENRQILDRLINNYSFVEYKPEMKKEELINEYRNSDIFVMPSFTETFGLSYVEAMSQGLPIIYTQGQGFDQQFEEGLVGYHVDPNSENDIADKIRLIYERFGEIIKNCVTECRKYDWSKISEEYISVYRDIKDKCDDEEVSTGY